MLEKLWPWWPVGLFVTVAALLRWLTKPRPPHQQPLYQKRTSLASDSERHFYHLLQSAVGQERTVFLKVPVCEIIEVPDDVEHADAWQGQLASHAATFLVCESRSLAPLAVVEMNGDASDDTPFTQALASAGLPLVRIAEQPRYDAEDLRSQVEQAISGNA